MGSTLGAGAMGTVHEAFDEVLGRTVALKILRRDLWESERARERMAREASALGRVTHPNVIGIYNVFEYEGALVLELEHAAAGTLREVMARGPLPEAAAVALLRAVLAGLEAIHAAGVVHRDLKPSNILIAGDGTPKIGDLGIARDLQAQALTATGTALGTAEYMAPEQVSGSSVEPATDLYACGVILYELIAGTVPFQHASEFEVLRAQVSRAPDLAPLQGRASPSVVHAVARALAKAPLHRWATAREFSAALGNAPLVLSSAPKQRSSQSKRRKRPAPVGPGTEIVVSVFGRAPRARGWLLVAVPLFALALLLLAAALVLTVVGLTEIDVTRFLRGRYL
jgi:serine/threonine-protein kinase